MIKNFRFVLVNLLTLMFALGAYSQACPGSALAVTLSNITNNPASNTIEFDVNVRNTGTTTLKLASLSGAVFHNAGFATTGNFTIVDEPNVGLFPSLNSIAATAYTPSTSQMRWTQNPVTEPSSVVMPNGVLMKFARFRFVRTGSNFPPDFTVTLTLAEYVATGVTALNPVVYCNGNPNSFAMANGTFPTNNGYLNVGGPYTTTVNSSCATTGTYTSTPVTCFGGNNGTATITLANNIPSSPNATYILDSGTPVPVTVSTSGTFTISGLTAGSHTLSVIGNGSCNTPISIPLTIGGPSTGLTNSTTVTNCDTYTWGVTGTTYTTSGTYTGTTTNGSGCSVAETLNLTINNSTTGTTTATACNTYTWALPLGNGTTYTASTTATNVTTNAAGCPHTQTLNLTINNSTSNTNNATACNTYTWAAPLGNGQTYTTSQTGLTNVSTNAAGCPHTETLNLTINNATAGVTTTTACDSYTWALPLGNGTTYTTDQNGLVNITTNAAGCPHTQTLNLTINNSTTGATTATACNTYTWALPLGNGTTYTASTTATNVTTNAAGCPHTQTLNLTINNSTSGTTTATACDTYTWALPLGTGTTYTTSQTGITNITTNAAGCPHTQTLNLTINNSTTGTTTTTACDTYTWALPLGNGTTYTTSQTGVTFVSTNAAGCPHTQTLNLTINNSTSGTTTASACSTYTWALPLGNGTTYTTSQTGITNVTTNAAGCPHTQTLNLTINNSTSGTTTATACDTYTWALPLGNGTTYTTSQTGITNVTTNAAGCPHTQTLNLTINNTSSGTTTATACDTYTWALPLGNGTTYTASTTATNVTTNASGCPHTQTLNLTINNSTSGTTTASACSTYTWALPVGNGQTYTTNQTGITNVTTNAAGCPHTQTLNLTINSTSGTTTATACDTYTWALPLGTGTTYTTSQTGITNVTTNAAGCPHTQTLNLTINTSTAATTTATACDTYTWALPLGNGQTYTTSQTGVTNVTTNAAGCPHTQTLNLTINNSTTGTTTATNCDSYTWALPLGTGITYTTSQNGITNITTNAAGCPHTQTLNLTINNSTVGTTTATACNTYTWALPLGNGQTYTTSQSGVTNVTTNAAGCSHTQTLNLTINTSTTGTTTATACDAYNWGFPLGNGQTYTTNQTGITNVSTNAAGCPHTQTLNLTINNSTSATSNVSSCDTYTWAAPLGNGQTYTNSIIVNNVTTNAAGCPHTQTLVLTIKHSTSGTSTVTACNSYTWAAPRGNGQTYTTNQTGLTNVSTNAVGCSHTQTLNLTINSSTTHTTTATACNQYTWAAPLGNGNTYTASTTATNVTTNLAGCSHTETLNLTINNSTSHTTNVVACDTYTWAAPLGNGQTYTTSTTALNVTTNAAGCTHTEKLVLSIRHASAGTTNAVACTTYTWALPLGNGQTYTTSQTGLTNVTTNSSGCPHTQTLNLVIGTATSHTTTATACNSYVWTTPLGTGFTYTASQTGLTHTSINAGGCTHTETLNLTINRSTTHRSTVVACGSYTWAAPLGNGQTYTTSQTGLTNTSTNAAGCTHIEVLNLTINQNTTYGNVTTTAQNSYTWAANGVTYTTSGVYTYTSVNSGGCQNVATLNLTIILGTTWYLDADGDGYGNPATTLFAATQPAGYVAIGTDCDDTRPLVHPGAAEICYDGLDNDCNGVIDNVGMPGGCTPITTSLMAVHCGSTITNLSTVIKAYYVVGAQGYRFRVRNLTTNAVQIKDRPTNSFTLSSLIGINIGTSYQVDVALLLNGVWQPFYGTACIINTASPVSTIGSQCGTTLSSMSQWVYATYYSTASGYRFRVTNTATSAVQTLTTTLNRFNFNQLPSHTYATTYFVEVALRNTDGTFLPYGPGCNITTPPSAREANTIIGDDTNTNTVTDTDSSVKFKVIAYPNPFAENFKLNVTTTDESIIQIRAYDMLGKQLENRNVEVNEIENLQIGANYPSGVYNIIVTQGNTTQTLRVIKR